MKKNLKINLASVGIQKLLSSFNKKSFWSGNFLSCLSAPLHIRHHYYDQVSSLFANTIRYLHNFIFAHMYILLGASWKPFDVSRGEKYGFEIHKSWLNFLICMFPYCNFKVLKFTNLFTLEMYISKVSKSFSFQIKNLNEFDMKIWKSRN